MRNIPLIKATGWALPMLKLMCVCEASWETAAQANEGGETKRNKQ